MSRYMLRVFESRTICPICKDLIRHVPDEVFGDSYVCSRCGRKFYCVTPGYTDHEYLASDEYSEALMMLADEA